MYVYKKVYLNDERESLKKYTHRKKYPPSLGMELWNMWKGKEHSIFTASIHFKPAEKTVLLTH